MYARKRFQRRPHAYQRVENDTVRLLTTTATTCATVTLLVAVAVSLANIGLFIPAIVVNNQQNNKLNTVSKVCDQLNQNISSIEAQVVDLEMGAGTDPVLNETVYILEQAINSLDNKLEGIVDSVEMLIMNAVERDIVQLEPGETQVLLNGTGNWVFGQYFKITNCFCNNMLYQMSIEAFDPDTLMSVIPNTLVAKQVLVGVLSTFQRTALSQPRPLSLNSTLVVFDNLGTNRAIDTSVSYYFAIKVD